MLVVLLTLAAGPVAGPPAAGRPGLWTKATTVASIRAKWMTRPQFGKLQAAAHPDRVLEFFSPLNARTLMAVALETGFAPILKALKDPGVEVAIPDKNLAVAVRLDRQKGAGGKEAVRPVVVLRVTRIRPAPPPLPLPGG